MSNNDSSSDHSQVDYSDPSEQVATPVLTLPIVPIVTGEENYDCIFKMRAKLYRFRDDEWKERGTGQFKLLRHKTNHRIRAVMRQEKTLKVVANF